MNDSTRVGCWATGMFVLIMWLFIWLMVLFWSEGYDTGYERGQQEITK